MKTTTSSVAPASASATDRDGVRNEESSCGHACDLNSPSLFLLLYRLWLHLAPKRRWQLGLLLAVMVASGLAEVASLAAVVPMLSVLTDPNRLWQIPWINALSHRNGLSDPHDLLLPATLVFAVSAVASAAIRLMNLWLSSQVAGAIGGDLARDAYRRTLYQAYSVHTSRNSSTVLVGIFTHIYRTVSGVIYPCMQLTTGGLIIGCIVAGLLAIDRFAALVTMATLATSYGLISFLTKQRLMNNSRLQVEKSLLVSQTVHEGLGGIRDILLDRSQRYHVDRFSTDDRCLRALQAEAEFLGGFPRFLIEGLAMAGIASLSLLLARQPGGLVAALPALGALALGAQRMLPAAQQAYASFTSVRACTSDLHAALDLLCQPAPADDPLAIAPTDFCDRLSLENVSFRYQYDQPFVLHDVNLVIQRGERIAIVGPTGSGKSTLADILMGLLEPTAGRLLVDGRCVAADAWQANIAHVPQSIFLADATIAENIAIGIPSKEIDLGRLQEAAAQAQISDYIGSLSDRFDTRVGEHGVRLSGGQRQRIAIARAFYKQASVLVFDEVTSALDNETERKLMEMIGGLSRRLTVLLVTHRLTATEYCDRILRVENGGVRIHSSAPAQLSARAHTAPRPGSSWPVPRVN